MRPYSASATPFAICTVRVCTGARCRIACSRPVRIACLGDLSTQYGGRCRCEPVAERCPRSEEHTSELQSRQYLVCRLLLEQKKTHPAGLLKHHPRVHPLAIIFNGNPQRPRQDPIQPFILMTEHYMIYLCSDANDALLICGH